MIPANKLRFKINWEQALPVRLLILTGLLMSGSPAIALEGIQDLYVGSNSSDQTTSFTSATNSFGNTYVGFDSGDSNNTLTVANPDTLLTNSQLLYVGYAGSNNSLVISNGGTVSDTRGNIGEGTNSSGSVTVSGGLWSNDQLLFVGNFGSGSLTIIGGTVADSNGVIANNSGSAGSVTVSGGLWTNTFLNIGNLGTGTLVISGGTVADTGCAIAFNSGSTGSVTVSSGLWTNSAPLSVGNRGTGSLLISGGTVADTFGSIGGGPGSAGSVTVSGGLWTNSNYLYIGGGGTGNLTISSNGTVIATGGMLIAVPSNSTVSTLNIGTYGGSDTVASNALMTPSISFGTNTGTGTINFNQANSFAMTSSITGVGSINQLGSGTTILSGSNSYSGATTITNGTLVAASNGAFGVSAVTLNGGTLSLSTNVTISSLVWNSSGFLALPSATNGAYLSITGALTLTGSGTNTLNLTGVTLGGTPIELLAWGGENAYTITNFSVSGMTNKYSLSISNSDSLWINIVIPDLYVGSNSTVSPTNFTSGTNNFGNIYVGFATNASKNLLTIGKAGTVLTNSSNLYVGYLGAGNRMQVTNGGLVSDATGYVGYGFQSSNNSVLVTGTGSTWSNSGNLTVGYSGSSNSLTISNGGKVFDTSGYLDFAEGGSSNNSALVTGIGSLWSNSANLYVGYDGSSNRLLISSGGTVVDANGYIDAKSLPSSNNSVLVTGSNSLWSNNGVLYVGYGGSGNTLSISNGGRVVVTGDTNTNDYVIGNGFVIGYGTNSSNNTVLVSGAGSVLTNTSANNDSFNVGWRGSSNSLVISNGGTVNTKYGNIGYTNGTGNSVLVTGSNSTWNGSELYVGHWNSGNTLTVTGGGKVLLDSYLGIGSFQPGANSNAAIITGAGSLLSVGASGEIDVGGENGTGNSLLITNKGAVYSQTAIIGSYGGDPNISSSNSVLVTGTGSVWSNTGTFTIGQTGSGNTLVITNGAHVINGGAVIGDSNTASNNSVLVTGSGSVWSNSGSLTVGNSGGGTLSIGNGGMVSDSGASIGDASGSIGSATLSGGVWTNSYNTLLVGNNGTGSLALGSGTLSDSGASIGNAQGSFGSVTVSGGLWTNGAVNFGTGILFIGKGGTGSLTVSGTGTVSASALIIALNSTSGSPGLNPGLSDPTNMMGGIIIGTKTGIIGTGSSSSGTLNIGSLGGHDAAGTISTPTISFGSGAGTINFNQSNTTALSSVIAGRGSVNQLGSGTTILSGSNSYSGTTTVTDGALVAASTNALGVSAVVINGGTLSIQTNLSVGSLTWNSAATVALPNLGKGAFLDVGGLFALSGSGTNAFNVPASALSAVPTELLGWDFTNNGIETGNFSLPGVSNYYLSISNNALWAQILGNLYVGSNSTVAATNFTSGTHLYSNTYVGFAAKGNKNLLTIGGPGTVLNNITNLTVGYSGTGNSMVVSNGGSVFDVNGTIGTSNTSTGNSVLVTGAGSLWSNSGTVSVGDAGGGTLTVASGGTVVAPGGITVASQAGSSGTLGIGSLPSSSGSGTFTSPSITFGLGKSMISTTGTVQGGSNSILPGITFNLKDPLQVSLTNSTMGFSVPLGGSTTNTGNLTYTFNISGSSLYEVVTTNGPTLQPITDTTWDNISTNWHTNANGAAVVFASSNNFLYNATFTADGGTLVVPTNGVIANQVIFIDHSTQNIAGGTINATSFAKGGQGRLNLGNALALLGSFSNTDNGTANLTGSILSGAVSQSGTGTLILAASNSYAGETVVSGGTLVAGNSSSFGSSGVYMEGNGTISASSTVNITNAVSLLGKASLVLNASSSSNGLTESGVIGGTGSLVVSGKGTVTLNGTNTYIGGTTVSLGSLAASSLGSGPLVVQASKGNMADFIDTMGSGTLSLGAVTLGGNASIDILNPYGSILSSGAVTITGTNNFIDLSGAWTNLGTYSLLSGTKVAGTGLKALELSGSFLGGLDLSLNHSTNYNGLDYTFINSATTLELQVSSLTMPTLVRHADSLFIPSGVPAGVVSVSAVPEPSTYGLLGLGVLALGITVSRRRV